MSFGEGRYRRALARIRDRGERKAARRSNGLWLDLIGFALFFGVLGGLWLWWFYG